MFICPPGVSLREGFRMPVVQLSRTVRNVILGCVRPRPKAPPLAMIQAPAGMPARQRDVFPLLISSDQKLCFNKDCGPTSARVLVTTIPKSGTYFIGKLLEILGLRPTGVHLYEDHAQDLRGQNRDEALDEGNVQVWMPIDQSLSLVRAGQFAVGHVMHTPRAEAAAADFTILYSVRNIRDCLVSLLRFTERLKRSGPDPEWMRIRPKPDRMLAFFDHPAVQHFFLGLARGTLPWMNHPRAIPVRYEALVGDEGRDRAIELVMAIRERVGLPSDRRLAAQSLAEAVAAETITKSNGRSQWSDYSNARVEERFRQLGCEEMNRTLGYS